jgi:site-specific recombinase XerD
MPDLAALGPWLRRFLCEHIITERNLARNTRKSYRDTFSLLLPFVSRKVRKPVDRLAVWDLTSGHVLQFLAHLETDRGCTARTRNQRLAAIRAFARFVGSRIRPMSNGAVTSGPSRRRGPCRCRSDG